MSTPPDSWTQSQIDGYQEWIDSRPPRVRKVAEKLAPWQLYRLKSSGHTVSLHSYDEPEDESQPVTLKVTVLRQYNPDVLFDRTVFGIAPEDLEPILEDVG